MNDNFKANGLSGFNIPKAQTKKQIFQSAIADVLDTTSLVKEDRNQVKEVMSDFLSDMAFDFWTISDVQKRVKKTIGQNIHNDLAGKVTELMCEGLVHGSGFSYDFVDQQISNAFDQRYSNVIIFPATDDEPPKYPVDPNIADKFIAVGILADTEYPNQEGDHEIITDIGSDHSDAIKFANRISDMTNHHVGISIDIDDGPSM